VLGEKRGDVGGGGALPSAFYEDEARAPTCTANPVFYLSQQGFGPLAGPPPNLYASAKKRRAGGALRARRKGHCSHLYLFFSRPSAGTRQ
jgi:hypothetical protein